MDTFRCSHKQRERGIALLVALFALLLLSAIALSMIYAANMETAVSANVRDKQLASYAAASGLQLARNYLRPKGWLDPDSTDTTTTAGLKALATPVLQDVPALNKPNILYLVADSSVKPWDPSNDWHDPELCHEHLALGLTDTPGKACSGSGSLPSGNSWYYSIVDPKAIPLNYKWVRIQMKTGQSIRGNEVVDGTGAVGALQVCFDGKHQQRTPNTTSDGTCVSSRGVTGVLVTASGTNYDCSNLPTQPTVTISGGSPGSGATAHVSSCKTNGTGQVASIQITNPGSGYTSNPTVTLTGGDGTGAVASAIIGGGHVTHVSLTNAGTGCYSSPPAVSIAGGSGTGATATAVLGSSNDCVLSFSTSGSCKAAAGSTVPVGLTGGGGSGATGTIKWKSGSGSFVSPANVTATGSGYANNPTGFSGLPAGCSNTPSAVALGKRVTSLTLGNPGSGYASAPTVTFPNGGAGTATISGGGGAAGQITQINVTNGGTGYFTTPPTVTISGGGGTGATAVAVLGTTTSIDTITVDNPGINYVVSNPPSVTIGPPSAGGNQATAVATVQGTDFLGRIFLLTSLGVGPRGSKTLMQMEAANWPLKFNFYTGALTIDGPNPILQNVPNSQNFKILGTDNPTRPAWCPLTTKPPHPSVGVFDDSAVAAATNTLSSGGAKPGNYTGTVGHTTPDVENVSASLGEANGTADGLNDLVASIQSFAESLGTAYGAGEPKAISSFSPTGTTRDSVTFINGNLTLGGNQHGYGVLLVTGDVVLSGDYSWNGPIYVIGTGSYNANGGGNGIIDGSLFVANTHGGPPTGLGSAIVNFDGGGGNGIQYDSCWADYLMSRIPYAPTRPQTFPLKLVSIRTINY